MKRILIMIAALMSFIACKKGEEHNGPAIDFKMTEEIIGDHTYKCVEIGGQTWMAENLKVRLNGGRADGCMTYNEVEVKSVSKSMLAEELSKSLSDGAFGPDVMNEMMCDYVINYEIIPNYMTVGGRYYFRNWEEYSELYRSDPNNSWALEYFDQVEVEFLKIEVGLKDKLVLEAADLNYADEFGYLYTYEASKKIAPAGWRVPTDEDWKKLESELGMGRSDIEALDIWRGNIGHNMKAVSGQSNFNAKMGGGLVYGTYLYGDNYIHKGTREYWWSSTKHLDADTASLYIIRGVRLDNDQMLRGTSRSNAAYHIRLVKN